MPVSLSTEVGYQFVFYARNLSYHLEIAIHLLIAYHFHLIAIPHKYLHSFRKNDACELYTGLNPALLHIMGPVLRHFNIFFLKVFEVHISESTVYLKEKCISDCSEALVVNFSGPDGVYFVVGKVIYGFSYMTNLKPLKNAA